MSQSYLVKFFRMASLVVKLSFRQLRSEKYFAIAMTVNMALGLIGYLTVDGFNKSFLREISARTRQIAGGDLIVSARQPWNERHLEILAKKIPPGSTQAEEVSMVSMISFGQKSRLIDLRFVSNTYPLYQGLELRDRGLVPVGSAHELGVNQVWIYSELQSQLGLEVGSRVRVGDAEFLVSGLIADDPSSGSGSFSFAPRVYLPLAAAQSTNLLGVGSRSMYLLRYKLPVGLDAEDLAVQLKKAFSESFPGQDIRARSHGQSSQETQRLYAYLNDYLLLISLVSLYLAALGFAYLVKSHLDSSIVEMAIVSSLGGSRLISYGVYLLQCLILGFFAIFCATILAAGLLPLLAVVMKPFAGGMEGLNVSVLSGLRAGGMCVLAGTLLSLPRLLKLWHLNPSFLFHESAQAGDLKPSRAWLGVIPAILVLWLSAIFESRSLNTGSVFAGLFVGLAGILILASIPLSAMALRFSHVPGYSWMLSLSLRLLSRSRVATISTFVALAIGATLINLIPQLRSVISREVTRPDTNLPQLFMFDIQDEQVEDVRKYFESKRARITSFEPMVRARLEQINNEPASSRKMNFEGEREEQQRDALQSRTQNLSFRSKLSAAEVLDKGEFISTPFTGEGLPALSIEEGFGRRVGVGIGDRMTFDVMGVSVEGVVTSLRRVRWTSFEPNFMILVQPGVLDEAPKMWVGSVSNLSEGSLDDAISGIVAMHSNISVVDVKASIKRLLVLIDKISAAVAVVAWLSLLGGFGVLFAIAHARSTEREHSMGLLKVLGATPQGAQMSALLEYSLIAVFAVIFGVGLSLIISWTIAVYILKAPWGVLELRSIFNGLVLLPITVFIAWLTTRKAVRTDILKLLG